MFKYLIVFFKQVGIFGPVMEILVILNKYNTECYLDCGEFALQGLIGVLRQHP
jgi:hypothetical protein